MGTHGLEERVAALEAVVARIVERIGGGTAHDDAPPNPWWEQISGAFANDPDFEEATRLGRDYRESLRPLIHVPQKD